MKRSYKKKTTKVDEVSEPTTENKVVKNNSAFKRAMVQMDVKQGDKVSVVFDDGTVYTVEYL